jgi:tripartite-type tricarboxylate transporter receptor subunit TctC
MVVPFSPGGGTDINARILAVPLGQVLGQTVVVDNRPGAGSIIGTDIVSKATPDGYTILLGTSSLAVNYAVYKKLPFDARRDFSPISQVSDQPNMMVVNPSLPAKNLKEFIALVQSQPGRLTFGSPGTGTATHLATVLLLSKFNGDLIHVPYKGTGPALTALIGGEINMYLSTFASALPHVVNRRLRALAVTGAERAGPLPDVPTVEEAGVPGYVHLTWYGMAAPAKTPRAIIDKLNKAIVGVLKSEEVSRLYKQQGLNAVPTTPAEFGQKIDEESKKWLEVVRKAKIPQRSLGGF